MYIYIQYTHANIEFSSLDLFKVEKWKFPLKQYLHSAERKRTLYLKQKHKLGDLYQTCLYTNSDDNTFQFYMAHFFKYVRSYSVR